MSSRRTVPLHVRFWAKVSKSDGCWEWIGRKDGGGYGKVYDEGKRDLCAHRVAWALTYGPAPHDAQVLHRCDNPACVRPDHLFLGTNTDNMRDMVAKGRHSQSRKTHCPNGHPYDEENTMRRKTNSGAARVCRACVKARYARKVAA